MKVSHKLHFKFLVAMIIVQQLVNSLPLKDLDEPDTDAVQKRNAMISEARQTLRQLEQIERYYQHLYIRGLLNDNESVNLERLQDFIEQLRHVINTTERPRLK